MFWNASFALKLLICFSKSALQSTKISQVIKQNKNIGLTLQKNNYHKVVSLPPSPPQYFYATFQVKKPYSKRRINSI